jgi:hypothetical protein
MPKRTKKTKKPARRTARKSRTARPVTPPVTPALEALTGRVRKFECTLTCYVTLEIDEAVLTEANLRAAAEAIVPSLSQPRGAAAHIAYNMVANNLQLESIDGFANFPNAAAKLFNIDWEQETNEITEKRTG